MQRLSLPESAPSWLEVWLLALDPGAPVVADDYRLMSEAELARVRRLRHPADVVRSVATRAALRRLLASRVGIAEDALVFTENAHGKPRLRNGDGPAFNVSHAGDHALIALARYGEVGVDIERCRSEAECAPLCAFVLSPSERRDHDSGEAALPFIERWVVKEAALKALGLGIGEYLQAVSIAPSRLRPHAYRLDHRLPVRSPLKAWALSVPAGYAAALAHAETSPGEPDSHHLAGAQPCTAMTRHR